MRTGELDAAPRAAHRQVAEIGAAQVRDRDANLERAIVVAARLVAARYIRELDAERGEETWLERRDPAAHDHRSDLGIGTGVDHRLGLELGLGQLLGAGIRHRDAGRLGTRCQGQGGGDEGDQAEIETEGEINASCRHWVIIALMPRAHLPKIVGVRRATQPATVSYYLRAMVIRLSDDKKPPAPKREGERQTGLVLDERTRTKKPPMYKVLLHNDDYTTREFVVWVLQSVFHKNETDAIAIMSHVHNNGVGVAGVYTFEVAETKVTKTMALAKAQQFPLQLSIEPTD